MPESNDAISSAVNNVLALTNKVPAHHQGLHFEDLLLIDHKTSEDVQRVGRALAICWARRNTGNSLLFRLLASESSPRNIMVARSLREWDVTYLTAATIIQWFGTPDGMSFLSEAFTSGGGILQYRYS